MYEIVDKSTRFRQVRQLLLSLICRFNCAHVILQKTWNWRNRSKEAIILRWAPSWIFTVMNWAERYCIRKYLDLAPTSLKCHTSPPPNPSGLSSPRPPRVRRCSDRASTRFRIYNKFKNFFPGERIQIFADSPAAGFTGYVWKEAGSAKKKLRIQKYRDTCGRGLNL